METLETQEREILAPLGAVLGCYGVSEQLAAVALCSRQMEDALSQAQQALQERGRMYMSLSAVGGLMLAILLM
jgi:stage III sporulation protein AB